VFSPDRHCVVSMLKHYVSDPGTASVFRPNKTE